jgi:hypothetical protein
MCPVICVEVHNCVLLALVCSSWALNCLLFTCIIIIYLRPKLSYIFPVMSSWAHNSPSYALIIITNLRGERIIALYLRAELYYFRPGFVKTHNKTSCLTGSHIPPGSEALTAMALKSTAFWDMTLRSSVEDRRRFWGTHCLHQISALLAACSCCFLASPYSSTLELGRICSSEMSMNFLPATQRYIWFMSETPNMSLVLQLGVYIILLLCQRGWNKHGMENIV